ncbi:translation initiation factor IF-2-like [Panicum virgatum]|uniref:translation initiation factor IF-2-like n=1 Tax=Panicum virgatum TaxID=38727 RepID=UPI0019D57D5F|nr:translation initiation factor IF-2-like [Panicum virgatum]
MAAGGATAPGHRPSKGGGVVCSQPAAAPTALRGRGSPATGSSRRPMRAVRPAHAAASAPGHEGKGERPAVVRCGAKGRAPALAASAASSCKGEGSRAATGRPLATCCRGGRGRGRGGAGLPPRHGGEDEDAALPPTSSLGRRRPWKGGGEQGQAPPRSHTRPSVAAAAAEQGQAKQQHWQNGKHGPRLPIERGRGQRKGAYPRRLPIRLPLLVPLSNACEGGLEEQQRHRQATPALRSSPHALTLCRAHLPAALPTEWPLEDDQ